MRSCTCFFTRFLSGFLKPEFNPEFNEPYLLLTPLDMQDGIVVFRVPGYTAGHLKVSSPDSLSMACVSQFTIDSVVLYPRSDSLSSFSADLTEELLRERFAGTVCQLDEFFSMEGTE